MVNIDDYTEVKICVYKGEHYSVRDNGAIMRHQRECMPKRKLDEVWSFGNPSAVTGYMDFCGERVHRIVATAFHGIAPTTEHVVDHIDTNRQNNRPENLRWVTKFENALLNPITRAKIEYICGSIDAFIADPYLLYNYERVDPNFGWMRTVSPEEARVSYERLLNWAKEHPNIKGGSLGEWVFKEQRTNTIQTRNVTTLLPQNIKEEIDDIKASYDSVEEDDEPLKTQSLTSNAIQLNWKYPVEFPCCPMQFSDYPLKAYFENLSEGKVFSKNKFGESTIIKFGMPQPDSLWVLCKIRISWKTHAITKITFKDGIFYHENMGAYDIGDEPEELFDSIINK